MKRILLAVCCIALGSFTVLAQKKAAGASAMTDQQFVDFAAQTDMVEANLGQLAQTAVFFPASERLREMLVTDYTKDFNQLYDTAHQTSLNRPDAIDAALNKKMIDPFQKLQGAAFDRHYIQGMIAGRTPGDRHLQERSFRRAEPRSQGLCGADPARAAKAS